jgi:hypothetical protein
MSVNTPVNPPCVTPHSYKGKKTLYYDPAKSETFKALKDSELGDTMFEIPEPVQPKVFTPQKHIQPPLNQMQRVRRKIGNFKAPYSLFLGTF